MSGEITLIDTSYYKTYNTRMENGINKFHWSEDPEDKTEIELNIPIDPPPHCGGINETETNTSTERTMRPCCKCGKSWESTISEWIDGTCPHCGAYGADGKGGKRTPLIKKPLAESISDILPTEKKNHIIFTRIENIKINSHNKII